MYPQRVSIPLQGFREKSTLEKLNRPIDQSTLANGGSEHAWLFSVAIAISSDFRPTEFASVLPYSAKL